MPLPEDEVNQIFEDAWKHQEENNTPGKGSVGKVSLLVQDFTESIMSKYSFITIEETDGILYYDKGVYKKGGEILIAKRLEAAFGYELNDHNLNQAIGHIKRRTYRRHEELDADINIINLKNGLYDIENDELKPHTPRYLSIKQKPIVFDREAIAERFPSFISEVVYEREIQTAIDIIAYTFRRDYDIEAIFKLYGLGNNGKTVYTSLITALHGADNVSNIPLDKMLKNDFALSGLEDKDVNIDNELGHQTINESAVLKRLTGGSRQRIRVEKKNIDAYDTTLYAKLIFNANAIPDSTDHSDAYSRRMVILSFPIRFDATNEDKGLTKTLTTEKEISGIFNICMDALRRIVKTKEIHVNETTIEERRAKYERAVNPWKSFYQDAVWEYSQESDTTPKELFHKAYVQWCKEHTIPHEKYDQFCANMQNKIGLREKRVGPVSDRIRCWAGITLIPEYGGPEIEQERIKLDDSYGT